MVRNGSGTESEQKVEMDRPYPTQKSRLAYQPSSDIEKNSAIRAKDHQPELGKGTEAAQDRERWRLVAKALRSSGNEEKVNEPRQ